MPDIMIYIETESGGFDVVGTHLKVASNANCFAVLPKRPSVYELVVWEDPLYDTATWFKTKEYKMVHPGQWLRES